MRWLAVSFCLLVPVLATAQEADEDKGRITKFLESSLSGGGREVVIEGFKGALSSTVTMESMTISDADGVWLTLEDAVLDWNRAAILRGDIQVNTLSASKIILPRLPKTEPAPTTPEATPFALPELPVSINIGSLETNSLFLGEDIIGTDATFTVNGSFSLADGDGAADMKINRTDGSEGIFNLDAGFANATRLLKIDLFAKEGANGIVSNLAKFPDNPSLEFSVKGEGELEDFVARINLKSNEEERLTGLVALNVVADPNLPTPAPGEPLVDPMRVFSVDLQGDVTPLFIPQYRDFFGENVSLTSVVRSRANGRLLLDQLLLQTAHFGIKGELSIEPEGMPDRFNFDISMVSPDKSPVLLPLPGVETRLQEARLVAQYDQSLDDSWSLRGRINGFERETLKFETADLDGSGEILLGERPSATAKIHADVMGIETPDEGLRDALGDSVNFDTQLSWEKGGPLFVNALELIAKGIEATANAKVTEMSENMAIEGKAEARIDELSGFSTLAGRTLGGAASTTVAGNFAVLSGAFDVTLSATSQDLKIGIPQVDALAQGESQLFVSAKRDADGVTLRQVSLESDNLNAKANGTLNSKDGALDFEASLADTAAVLPDISGAASVKGNLTQNAEGLLAKVDATAPGGTTLSATVSDPASAALAANLEAQIEDISVFVPSLPGSATINAEVKEDNSNWQVLADVVGSVGSNAHIDGSVSQDFETADLSINGRLPLALANTVLRPNAVQGDASFDLKLNGKPSLESLSGNVTTSGAQFVLPSLQFALSDIATRIDIENSRANIQVSTNGSYGGDIRVSGGVDLIEPFTSNIDIALNRLVYQMGTLLTTTLNGQVAIGGPLASRPSVNGDIGLYATQVRLSTSALGGAGAVPEVSHRNEPSKVHQTRQFADLIKEPKAAGEAASTGSPVDLKLSVRTEERVVVDGLGLHANFEGGLDVIGTSSEIKTDGEFNLTRGRLTFVGKQFELTEGLIRLAGSFVPDIRVVAETTSGDTDFEIIVSGSATSPDLEMVSDPELPEEEMLSHLLFGKGVSNISAIQAAQLASAAATLSGGGQGALLRTRDSGGLDDFGLTTDEEGNAGLRAGKYINENIYTDITLDSKGDSTVNLNLDVTDSLTLKGSVDSESETGVGIFFRYDY
ncbi:translocation/assembly module TamB domain-containing protein [Shimia thalassica]|uniref:translocation/assembly module TamB domain-containing protein n=1 Tax=Shimia thalassica TaxID=1715693 RepID=UPI001C090595|nr:translocation/assembly module TamB domain-containing protein [Shimia thalassica]MBU2942325.1 translocation/assembly module TamB domain-containing protein [Shimia thalassica]MDO6504253.1 translocation/assembly module TamB domain-containing protein [Shimia thalassica]